MNFSQLHEALRLEILRRIDRGVLSGTLLAHQTGFKQPHISNFLRRRRYLSLNALDKILIAQGLTVADLLAGQARSSPISSRRPFGLGDAVPVVSQASAIHDPHIAAHEVMSLVMVPAGVLDAVTGRRSASRKKWQRFIAIRITAAQAEPMAPTLSPHGILVLDRHHVSLPPNRPGPPTLYAIGWDNQLMIRYVNGNANRLVLRTPRIDDLVQLIDMAPGQHPADFIVGRVCYIMGEP